VIGYCVVIVAMVVLRLFQRQHLLESSAAAEAAKAETEKPTISFANSFFALFKPRPLTISGDVSVARRRKMYFRLTAIVRRVILYPIVPILTQMGNIVVAVILQFYGSVSYEILFVSYVGTSVQGLLHFVAFCFDPTIHDAVRAEFYSSSSSNDGYDEMPRKANSIQKERQEHEEEGMSVSEEEIPEKPRATSIDSLANVPLPALSSWRIMPNDGLPMAPGATYSSMSPTVVNPYAFGATYSSINLGQIQRDREDSAELWDGSPIQVGMEDVELDASFRHL